MKCPICGNALKISKKNPEFALCYECRKKFRIPKKEEPKVEEKPEVPEKTEEPVDEDMIGATMVFSRREVRDALRKQNAARRAEKAAIKKQAEAANEEEGFHLRYANIPPKEIREKQEEEMKKAYDELLSIGKEERSKKKRGLFGRKR